MPDELQAALWIALLVAGLVACVLLRRAGILSTYIRDFLHVAAGVWVFGWPYWHSIAAPMAIVFGATAALLLIPRLAPRFAAMAQLQESVSGGDERWGGLVLYAVSFAWMTWMALRYRPFPAAAALLALALGDGLGGAVGRRFGRLHYSAPGGKRKSLEGSLAVSIAAAAGGWIASTYFQIPPSLQTLLGIGLIASVAEALAPKASDNALVPAAVFVFMRLNE